MSKPRSRLVATGQLQQDNGALTCKYEVWCEDRNAHSSKQTFRILLISDTGTGVVDFIEGITADKVFPWLDDRTDY